MKQLQKLLIAAGVMTMMAFSQGQAAEIACTSMGELNRCPLPNAHTLHVKIKQVLRGKCTFDKSWWTDSDGIVVDKGCGAVFKYKPAAASSSSTTSSGTDANASFFFDEGCKAGKEDKKIGQSMAYERHSDSYNTDNEGSFRAGYEKCWMSTKR